MFFIATITTSLNLKTAMAAYKGFRQNYLSLNFKMKFFAVRFEYLFDAKYIEQTKLNTDHIFYCHDWKI